MAYLLQSCSKLLLIIEHKYSTLHKLEVKYGKKSMAALMSTNYRSLFRSIWHLGQLGGVGRIV